MAKYTYKTKTSNAVVFTGAIVGILAIFFVIPVVALGIGWLTGFIIELVTGDFAMNSLNAIFGTERFVHGDFARLTAIAAVIGSFFAGNRTTSKTKE